MKFTLTIALVFAALLAVDAKPSKAITGCTSTFVVSAAKNETCLGVCATYGITFPDLLRLNPGLDTNCDNLDDGNTICVADPKTTPSAGASKGASSAPASGASSATSTPSSAPASISSSSASVASVTSAAANLSLATNSSSSSNSSSNSSSTQITAPPSLPSSGAILNNSPYVLGMIAAVALAALAL